MKNTILILLSLGTILLGCKKQIDNPLPAGAGNASYSSRVVPPVTIVTFGQVPSLRTIEIEESDIIFSDSVYIAEDEAMLSSLSFEVKGTKLEFNNCAMFVNGIRVPASGIYEDGILTIKPNRTLPLKMGNYQIDIHANVFCSPQIFAMRVQEDNILVTNYYYGFDAQLYGLPIFYGIRAIK